ncbi:MAG: hypothetical protein ACFCUM_08270 [Bacteroidales bacterium]
MIKTGFIGCPDRSELHTIIRHHEFKVTGCCPMSENIWKGYEPDNGISVISETELLNDCDIIMVGNTFTDITDLLKKAIKRSMPVMFLNPAILNSGLINDLIKLQEESQTVVYVSKAGRSKSLLLACLHLITHPSLFELRHFLNKPAHVNGHKYTSDLLFSILDALLFLCPLNYQKVHTFRHPQNFSETCLLSARIEFDNGSVANIISTDLSEGEYFTIDIYQKHRLLKIDLLKNQVLSLNKAGQGNEINSKTIEFNSTYEEEFSKELGNFHKAVIQNSSFGNELFNIARITDLSKKILTKAGFS